jgi:hypothetical protein
MTQQAVGINQPGTVNGMKTDWAAIRTKLFGTGITASHLKDISFSEQVTPTKPRGIHGIPLTSGPGFYTATASATMTNEAWLGVLGQLPDGYTTILDTVVLAFRPVGSPIIGQVKWMETRIIGVEDSYAQGQGDGLWVKVNFDLRYILRAGADAVFKCMYPLDLDAAGIATSIT